MNMTPGSNFSGEARPRHQWRINWLAFIIGPAITIIVGVILLFTIPSDPTGMAGSVLPTGSIRGFVLMILGFILLMWLLVFVGTLLVSKRKQSFVDSGVNATARILNAQRTGTYVNELPRVRFDLAVTRSDMPEYQTKVTATVPPEDLVALQPGAVVPVRVHPTKPHKVTFAS